MTEADLDQPQQSVPTMDSITEPPVLVQASLSIGQALAEKRLSQKLTIEDVSARIKYSVRFIQALGADAQPAEDALKDRIGVIRGGIANHTSTRSLATHETDRTQQSSVGWLALIGIVVVAAVAIAISQGIIPKALLPHWLGALVK